MWKHFISTLCLLGLGFAAALLFVFAVLVLPGYTAFMVIWMHVPPLDVLLFTGPIAVLSLILAVATIAVARGKRKDSGHTST